MYIRQWPQKTQKNLFSPRSAAISEPHCSNLYIRLFAQKQLGRHPSISSSKVQLSSETLSKEKNSVFFFFSIIKAAVHLGTHPFNIVFLYLIRSSAYFNIIISASKTIQSMSALFGLQISLNVFCITHSLLPALLLRRLRASLRLPNILF